MRISDWSSDVCSSDLIATQRIGMEGEGLCVVERDGPEAVDGRGRLQPEHVARRRAVQSRSIAVRERGVGGIFLPHIRPAASHVDDGPAQIIETVEDLVDLHQARAGDRKRTRLNSIHKYQSRMPSTD